MAVLVEFPLYIPTDTRDCEIPDPFEEAVFGNVSGLEDGKPTFQPDRFQRLVRQSEADSRLNISIKVGDENLHAARLTTRHLQGRGNITVKISGPDDSLRAAEKLQRSFVENVRACGLTAEKNPRSH